MIQRMRFFLSLINNKRSRKVPRPPRGLEIWSNKEITRPIGSESRVIYNLLGRAGLHERVVRLATQHSGASEGVVSLTSPYCINVENVKYHNVGIRNATIGRLLVCRNLCTFAA